MLEIIAAALSVLWLTGLAFSYTLGGFIHVLLMISVVLMLVSEQKVRAASPTPRGDHLTATNIFGIALVAASILSLVYGGAGVPVWAAVGGTVLGGLLLLVPEKGWTSTLALREAPPGIFLHSRRESAPGEIE